MKNAKILVIAILLVSAGLLPLFGNDIAPFTMSSPRFNGLGGFHTAYANDITALWVNPAALKGAKEFSLLEVSAGFYGPVFDLIKTMKEEEPMDALIDLLGGSNGFSAGANVGGPLSVGLVRNGFGFGFFNRAYLDGSFAGTMADVSLNVDVFGTFGFAFRLLEKGRHVLDVGALAKAFGRGNILLNANLLNLGSSDDILDELLENPLTLTIGFGFDLGVQYEYAERFRAALVCTDVYSPGWSQIRDIDLADNGGGSGANKFTYAGTIAPRLSGGLMFRLFDSNLIKLNIMADYRDILAFTRDGINRNPLLNVGVGAEMELLKFLIVRVGMTDCLPSAGLGFDLFICKIDLSVRGVELGLDPGVLPTYAFDVGVAFRW